MSSTKLSRARVAVSLPLLSLLTGCVFSIGSCVWPMEPNVWVEARDAFSVAADDIQRLDCKTHNGAVRATGESAATEVSVQVHMKAGGRDDLDAQDCLGAIKVESEVRDGALHLAWTWAEEPRSGWQAFVSFDISHPSSLAVAAETHNGAVEAEAVNGGVALVTHNGNVTVSGCSGRTRVNSHNGSVEADVKSSDVRIETHNGNVDLAVDGDGELHGLVSTHNGSVVIRLVGEPSVRLSCSTDNGGIRVDRALQSMHSDEHSLVGEVGAGEGRFDVETHNGGITVR